MPTPLLSSALALLRSRIDSSQQFLAGGSGICVSLWFGVEFRIGVVAGVEQIDLRPTRVGMPGVSIDRRDINYAIQVCRAIGVEASTSRKAAAFSSPVRSRGLRRHRPLERRTCDTNR